MCCTSLETIFFDYYSNHCTVNTTVYNGISELVGSLKAAGIKVGCITNKVEPVAKDIINTFFGGMDKVYGQTDGVPNKPDPMLTLRALSELGIKPQECLFVGDSEVDMQTACAAGCAGGRALGIQNARDFGRSRCKIYYL